MSRQEGESTRLMCVFHLDWKSAVICVYSLKVSYLEVVVVVVMRQE